MPPTLPALSELSIDTLLQPQHHAQPPPTHVRERGGPWDSVALDPTFYPSLQTTLLPMTIVYRRSPSLGWLPHLLVAESALLHRAGAPRGLGVYALTRFRGPREVGANDGDDIGYYGGAVVATAPTQQAADERAQSLVRQGRMYLMTMRVRGHAGWMVVDGEQQPVLPMLHRTNDPRGTAFAPRCIISEYGLVRAARDIAPLDWTRPLREQAASELSIEYGTDYWQMHDLLGTADLPLTVDMAFARLNIGGDSSSSRGPLLRRSSRLSTASASLEHPQAPELERVEKDRGGRVVYVDLHVGGSSDRTEQTLQALRQRLLTLQPTQQALARMPLINRGRALVEVDDEMALDLFQAWLVTTASSTGTMGEGLRQLLQPLGPRVLLLGVHFICPRIDEYQPCVRQQQFHTDVGTRGEVIGIGLNLRNEHMNTVIDPHATLHSSGEVRGGSGFRRAATPVFGFETAAVHAGPALSHAATTGPFPRFLTNRLFFLLASADLDPSKVAQHRADNALAGHANLIIAVPPAPAAPPLSILP